ncbi:hypothetical protein LCGC14_2667840 [marine sediment metagenome]|uniref:Uncharacterized protein n=1 Tax=marine sediment metagenome TaxID=412755 RepID=A0A0F9C049_9ZZZZ
MLSFDKKNNVYVLTKGEVIYLLCSAACVAALRAKDDRPPEADDRLFGCLQCGAPLAKELALA